MNIIQRLEKFLVAQALLLHHPPIQQAIFQVEQWAIFRHLQLLENGESLNKIQI